MALAHKLGLSVDTPVNEAVLYVRFVRVLAVLCECAPYVDEADYLDLIEQVLDDACSGYPLDWRRSEGHYEIAPRGDREGGDRPGP